MKRRMTKGEHMPLQMVHDANHTQPTDNKKPKQPLTLAILNRIHALMFRPSKEK